MDPLPNQPNFDNIARYHTDLARELGLCVNLPVIQEGNAILQELRAQREYMTGQLRAQREYMTGEFRALRECMMASNDNNIARLHNSQITKPDQPLMPLRSTLTNEPLPNFPQTPNDLQRLPNATVTEILRILGASTDGTVVMKRQRLRLNCGLKQEPI